MAQTDIVWQGLMKCSPCWDQQTCAHRARPPATSPASPSRRRWGESGWSPGDRPWRGPACRQDPHSCAWRGSSPAPTCWASSPCRPSRPGPSSRWWWDWRWCAGAGCAWSRPGQKVVLVLRRATRGTPGVRHSLIDLKMIVTSNQHCWGLRKLEKILNWDFKRIKRMSHRN